MIIFRLVSEQNEENVCYHNQNIEIKHTFLAFYKDILTTHKSSFIIMRSPSLLLRLDLKLSFFIKPLVMAGSGDAESSFGYTAIRLGCWGIPLVH